MKEGINIFISYSHTDSLLVTPIVKLLRVNQSFVFLDSDTITPGKKWQEKLLENINLSDLVIVFWCRHAHQSSEVSKEWNNAIEQDKDVLPILLDATPLPPILKQYQWIDFQKVVHHHRDFDTPAPAEIPPIPHPVRKAKHGMWRIIMATSISVFGLFGLWLLSLKWFILLPVAMVLVLIIIWLIRTRQDRSLIYPELSDQYPESPPAATRRRTPGDESPLWKLDELTKLESPTNYMAKEIEQEIHRRLHTNH